MIPLPICDNKNIIVLPIKPLLLLNSPSVRLNCSTITVSFNSPGNLPNQPSTPSKILIDQPSYQCVIQISQPNSMDLPSEISALIIMALLVIMEISILAMVRQSCSSYPDKIATCLIIAFYVATGYGFALATIFVPLPVNDPASVFALSAWGAVCLPIVVLAVLDFFARKVLARCIKDLQSHIAVHDEDGDVCPHQGCLDTMKKLRDDRIWTFSSIGFAAKELFGTKHKASDADVGEEVDEEFIQEKKELEV